MRRRRLTKALVPGGCVALIVLIALAAPLLPLPDPIRQDVAHRLAGPMAGSWLGRDEFGRDVLSRLVWGARTSLSVAFASALVFVSTDAQNHAFVAGTTTGAFPNFTNANNVNMLFVTQFEPD